MDELVPDFTDFIQAAQVTYNMFRAYTEVGFSEDQAIKIICGLLRNTPVPVAMNGQSGE